jgi:hypothetical protein
MEKLLTFGVLGLLSQNLDVTVLEKKHLIKYFS